LDVEIAEGVIYCLVRAFSTAPENRQIKPVPVIIGKRFDDERCPDTTTENDMRH